MLKQRSSAWTVLSAASWLQHFHRDKARWRDLLASAALSVVMHVQKHARSIQTTSTWQHVQSLVASARSLAAKWSRWSVLALKRQLWCY